jgi:hypothetical protein
MKRTTLLLTIIALFLFAWPMAANAQEQEIINTDLTSIGQPLTIEPYQTVNADVVVVGSSATVQGTVNGDLVVMGGNLEIGPTAVITGDCVVLGGTITGQSEHACQVVFNQTDLAEQLNKLGMDISQWVPNAPPAPVIPALPAVPDVPAVPQAPVAPHSTPVCIERQDDVCVAYETPAPLPPSYDSHGRDGRDWDDHGRDNRDHSPSFFAQVSGAAMWGLFMGLLAFGMATIAPEYVERVQRTARRKTVPSGVVGLLTSIAVPSAMTIIGLISLPLLLICGLGLIGAPILAILGLGMLLAALLGWVAMGGLVAGWLSRRFGWRMGDNLRTQAVVGTILLSFGINALAAVPLVPESLLRWPLYWVGLGAVVLTQFGRRYPHMNADGDDDEPEVDPNKIDIVLQTLPEDYK